MQKLLLAGIAFSIIIPSRAGDTSRIKPFVHWSLFADIYYSYDFNKPAHHEKAFFLFNHKRHNEINLNLALARASFESERIRAGIGLMAGTYAQYNLAQEQDLLQHVYEAWAGVRVSSRHNLWLDAGIFPSHLGSESAISNINPTLTRSLAAENSPYYLAGARFTGISSNEKWQGSVLLVNGWQRIRRVDGNQTPAFGTQLVWKPDETTLFNWSTFIGNDYPDTVRRWRYFNNLYAVIKPSDEWALTLGFDFGLEQESRGSSNLDNWFTPNAILRYTPGKPWSFAARGEFFRDREGVIIPTGTVNGFSTVGLSFNADLRIAKQALWRSEIRWLQSKDPLFIREGELKRGNTMLTTSLALSF